jgi:CDGSH-type Zn-finger protein/truncated hemoglobin YjbI
MTSPTKAGRGSLAQVIATRGGLATPEAPFVIEHREALIYMLCQAAELEHAIMCQYLYAAFSLRQSTEEGLTKAELAKVEQWRKTIANIATQEMLHLALVQNVLSAVGAAPHFARPNLPQPAGHYPPGVVLTLIPFGDTALKHFMFLERPEGMDLGDADGLAAAERSAPQMEEGEIVPRLQDFSTVGHLYRSIEEGIKHLSSKYGERWLFVGPPNAQASPDHFGWPALVEVVDAASAQRAIDTILEQGEGPRGHWRNAHFGRFVEILDEFEKLKKRNPRFDPVRPVLPATVRPREGDRVTPLIEDLVTAKCTDLFNVSYEVLLQTLGRYFAHTEESSSELATLANLTVGLMVQVIKPLGDLITTLPVGPGHPDRTSGPSFELFYESDYLLPHRDAAWALLEERLREAAAFCDRIRNQAPVDVGSRLEPIGSSVLSLAQMLADVRAAWGLTSHAGEVTVARRRQDAQAARGASDVEDELDRLNAAMRVAIAGEQDHLLASLLAAASLKSDASEGGLDGEQSELVRAWKRGLIDESSRHFERLADVVDVFVAVNGDAQLASPQSPEPGPGQSDARATFSAEVLERLGAGDGFDAEAAYQDIRACLVAVPPEALIVDPHPSRAVTAGRNPIRLEPVVDQSSAMAVVDRIVADLPSHASESTPKPSPAAPGTPSPEEIGQQLEREVQSRGDQFLPARDGAERRRGSSALRATSAPSHLFAETYAALLKALSSRVSFDEDAVGVRERNREAARRLFQRVLRPLAEALAQLPNAQLTDLRFPQLPNRTRRSHSLAADLRSLAISATRQRVRMADAPPELAEAVAGLHDLAAWNEDSSASRSPSVLDECRTAQAGLARSIQLTRNGPYLVTNVEDVHDWTGLGMKTRPQMALCRCGASASKPLCDGSHARIDFTGIKDPNRVPDRQDAYPGPTVTVLDNRGICQHSGFCTDRLPVAFRVDKEPFVAPNGGRMDEIIQAVRNCPSGALSLAIDGHEARDIVDWHDRRASTILVTRDGPYRTTGSIPLVDEWGQPAARNEGASLEHYALCRCGHSQNKPFCSGMHWYIDFRDPDIGADHEPTLYEWCGGLPALTRMARLFCERYLPEDPLLAPLFANMPADHPERLAKWLGQVFGGPTLYSDQYGDYAQALARYQGMSLSEELRERWVELICQAARETGLATTPEFWGAFTSYIEWGSSIALEQAQPGTTPSPRVDFPRWNWGPAGPPKVSATPTEPAEEDEEMDLPDEGEAVSFAAHIKGLFRERDRQSMKFAFDLWSYEDVKAHAQPIVEQLQAGTMPCDGAWTYEKIDAFQRWIDGGMTA